MTKHPEDRLSRELAKLPEITASSRFTEQTLARLDRRGAAAQRPVLRFAGATLVAVIAALTLWGVVVREPGVSGDVAASPARSSAADEALEQEYRQIAQELEELRRLADETAPILYLTSTEEFDVVLDLRPLLDAPRGRPTAAAVRRGEPVPARRDG